MGGKNTVSPTAFVFNFGQSGVFGMQGNPAHANTPGVRVGVASWVDASENLRPHGAEGNDSTGTPGYLNDAWQYQPGGSEESR